MADNRPECTLHREGQGWWRLLGGRPTLPVLTGEAPGGPPTVLASCLSLSSSPGLSYEPSSLLISTSLFPEIPSWPRLIMFRFLSLTQASL